MIADYAFYVISMVLAASIFCYGILSLKVYLAKEQMAELDARILTHTTEQEKVYQDKFTDYKKKINDFSTIIKDHKISSGIFVFIEEKTLPNVWFSNFDLSSSVSEIRLSGEAENLETVSRQIQLFEQDKYVKSIDVLHSEVQPTGKVGFLLTLSKLQQYSPAVQK